MVGTFEGDLTWVQLCRHLRVDFAGPRLVSLQHQEGNTFPASRFLADGVDVSPQAQSPGISARGFTFHPQLLYLEWWGSETLHLLTSASPSRSWWGRTTLVELVSQVPQAPLVVSWSPSGSLSTVGRVRFGDRRDVKI